MTRSRRRLVIGSTISLVGLLAVLFLVPLLLDQERLRTMMAERASRLLNHDVTVESVRVRLLPWPGATVRGLTIVDRPPSSRTFLEANRLDVTVRPLPLLRGEVQITQIRVDRPRIHVAHGSSGWNLAEVIRPAARSAMPAPQPGEGSRVPLEEPTLPLVFPGNLAIRDGTVIVDRPSDDGTVPLDIQSLNVDVAISPPPGPIRIAATGQLSGRRAASFELTGSVRSDQGDRIPVEARLRLRHADIVALAPFLGMPAPSTSPIAGSFDADATVAGDWPRLDVHAEVNLRRIATAPGDPAAKTAADDGLLRATGRWDGRALDVPELALRWNGQSITGRLHLAGVSPPNVRFELDLPELAVEPLIALAGELGSTEETSERSRGRRDGSAVRAGSAQRAAHPGRPDGVQLHGRIRSNAVRWRKLRLAGAEGELHYAAGRLDLRRLRAALYGGRVSGSAMFDWRARTPRATITARLDDVQTEPLLLALQEDPWKLQGVVMLDAHIELAGQLGRDALLRASGHSDLVVTEGRLTGYPPLDKVSQAFAPLLQGAGVSSGLNEFDVLTAHWTLDQGVLRTNDLVLQRHGARLYATGSVGIQDQRLDFDVTAKVPRATLEAKVSGTASDPVVTPNVGRIERRIKTEIGKALKDKRGEAIGKALRDLLSR